ncbi:MAG: hypothetical protein ACTS2F_10715 [Thainema sp.]
MKYFNPKVMKPNVSQFHEAVRDKISESGQQSIAYKAVLNLFEQAQSLYRSLDGVTSPNIAHLKDANKYLTQRQETDAIALTALYVRSLGTIFAHNAVKQDTTLSDQDRLVLEMAISLYRSTCDANYSTLGNPRWIDE